MEEACQTEEACDSEALRSKIREALQDGDFEAFKQLLANNPDRKQAVVSTETGSRVIHVACQFGRTDAVRYLLRESISALDERDNNSNTPLHIACEKGHVETVRTFIDSFDTSLVNSDSYTLLHIATAASKLSVITFLIDKGFDPCQFTETEQLNCLHIACKHGNLETARYLIEDLHIDPNIPAGPGINPVRPKGQKPVHFAALYGRLELLRYLVDGCNCDPNIEDDSGKTPTLMAGECSNVDVLKYLVEEKKCNPAHTARGTGKVAAGRQAVHGAGFSGNISVMKYLVEVCHISPFVKDEVGVSPFACAAQEGKLEVVQFICMCQVGGNDVNIQDATGRTPLHYACLKGRTAVVKYLATSVPGVDVDLLDNSGETCIIVAGKSGHKDIVSFLLMEKGCNVAISTSASRRIIDFAAAKDWLEIVAYLVTEKQANPEQLNEAGFSPLHYAAEEGALSVLQYFLEERKCNPNIMSQEGESGMTPVLRACMFGHLNIVRYLIDERKCSLSITTKNKMMTALHLACSGGHLSVARYLIESCGHELEPRNNQGAIPLHLAILNGRSDVVKYLIDDKHSDPLNKTKGGATGFHAACQGGHLMILLYLADHPRFSQFCRDLYSAPGGSPLDQAAEHGHLEIVEYLIVNSFCDPRKRGDNGFTCLHWAAQRGKTNVVSYLVDNDFCDPMASNMNGHLPLHLACGTGHEETVKYLLTKDKRQISCKDMNGLTPLQHAKKASLLSRDVLTSFLMAGADPDQLIEASPVTCKFLKSCLPIYSYSKVFLLGHSQCLVKELNIIEGEMHGSELQLSIPIRLTYRNFRIIGDIMLYEISSSVTSFDGVLTDAIASCEHPVFVICLDSNQDSEEIGYHLNYWQQFILSLLTHSELKPVRALLLVAININSNSDKEVVNEVSTFCLSLTIPDHKLLSSPQVIYCDEENENPPLFGALRLLKFLSLHSNSIQQSLPLGIFPNAVRAFTVQLFRSDVSSLCHTLSDISCNIIVEDAPLPSDINQLSDAFAVLSQTGHLTFLKDNDDIGESIIVLETDLVLQKMFEAINVFQSSGSLALVSTVELLSKCQDCALDSSLFLSLLQYMKVCIDITQSPQVRKYQSTAKQESWFFFPSLLAKTPEADFTVHTDDSYEVSLGWLLECEPPSLLGAPLCNLLPIVAATSTDPPLVCCTQQNGSYNVWSGGVQYAYETQQVTLTHLQGEAIVLVIKDLRKNLLSMTKRRSRIIENIFSLRDQHCPEISTQEYLLHPSCLTSICFDSSGPSLSAISVTDILNTLGQTEEAFGCLLEELAGIEPLFILGKEFSSKFFDSDRSLCAISSEDQQYLITKFTPYCEECAKMLGENLSTGLDSDYERIQRVVDEWMGKDRTVRTYKDLWNCFKSFSIFSDQSPPPL